VLATSNRDLADAVKDGQLREDLYYRLSVFPLVLPPLRERRADVLPLAQHFLAKHAHDAVPYLSNEAQSVLESYGWPGNVRELENCMQRALVLSTGECVQPIDLGLDMESVAVQDDDSLQQQMRTTQDQLLLRTLEENQGVRKASAVQLGISERTLRYKLKQLRDRGILA
jgi:two-component system response regulator FlrC